jgi:hypothetical protein
MLRMSAFTLLVLASPALAMNWEGKDDWMAEIPQAQALEHHLPSALPKATKFCASAPSTNPYEQVQIPGKNCRPAGSDAAPKH